MLTHRSVSAELLNIKISKEVQRGCPQGGVLSPLLWNMVIDELLCELHGGLPSVHSQAFADDVCGVQAGIDFGIVRGRVVSALRTILKWCRKRGFAANPQKFDVVRFSLK